jgi:heme/copper-type cytochrome/quinol oxidase subunit 2
MASYVGKQALQDRRALRSWFASVEASEEDEMLTVAFVAMIVALLVVGGVIALMVKDQRRKEHSGTAGPAAPAAHGRASGFHWR